MQAAESRIWEILHSRWLDIKINGMMKGQETYRIKEL